MKTNSQPKIREIPLKCFGCPRDGSDYVKGKHICTAGKCNRDDKFDTQEEKHGKNRK